MEQWRPLSGPSNGAAGRYQVSPVYAPMDNHFRFSYAVLAVEMGGHAVRKVYEENDLKVREKGGTDVGKAELLTKADLVSNHLIMDLIHRFPLLKACLSNQPTVRTSHLGSHRGEVGDLVRRGSGEIQKRQLRSLVELARRTGPPPVEEIRPQPTDNVDRSARRYAGIHR